jgi:hypothetical protein
MIEMLVYFRIVIYAVASLGMFMIAVVEYQTSKDKLRLGIMLSVALLLLVWMVITMGSIGFPYLVVPVRSFALTPLLIILTLFIYIYLLRRTRHS